MASAVEMTVEMLAEIAVVFVGDDGKGCVGVECERIWANLPVGSLYVVSHIFCMFRVRNS